MAVIVPEVTHDPIRLAVLVSGGGRTLANLPQRIPADVLRMEIPIAICSNPRVYERIQENFPEAALDVQLVNRKDYDSPAEFSDVVFRLIREAEVDLVVLAGFLSLLVIPDEFAHRVVNIHPALLPAFGGKGMYGDHVHAAVLAAGCKVTGCTVHFADQTYDTGPIILQKTCPVLDGDTPDTLATRVFEQECEAYPEAVRLIGERRVGIHGRVTRIESSDLIARARRLCMMAHAGQKRSGGHPYYTHPIAVAQIVRDAGIDDPEMIAAACLHDVVEDSPTTLDDISAQFGPRVAKLVDELTLPDEPGRTFERKHQQLAEHARVMSDDAKIIKIADRLHNMSEIEDRPAEKWPRYAAATEELLEALTPWPAVMDPAVEQLRQVVVRYKSPVG